MDMRSASSGRGSKDVNVKEGGRGSNGGCDESTIRPDAEDQRCPSAPTRTPCVQGREIEDQPLRSTSTSKSVHMCLLGGVCKAATAWVRGWFTVNTRLFAAPPSAYFQDADAVALRSPAKREEGRAADVGVGQGRKDAPRYS
jgi:hypothetical protein